MSEDPINELNLDILGAIPVGPGRKSSPLHAEFSRELTALDMALPNAKAEAQGNIKKLRSSHHAAARYFSLGMTNGEVAAITGYTEARLSVLKSDPSFRELIAFYQNHAADQTANLRDRMLTVGMDAVEILQERLDETPEVFKNGELTDIVRTMADRTGNGPSSTAVNVNVSAELSDVMARARARVEKMKAAREAKVVEGTATEVSEK